MPLNVTANTITSLGGILGGLLNTHSQATTQLASLLAEAQNAVAANDWAEVQTIANGILLTPGASQTTMSMARNLAHAASSAVSAYTAAAGTPNFALVNLTNQQLVLSEVNALSQQLSQENSGLFHHLFGASHLARTGRSF